MLNGARQGKLSGLRRWVAGAMARDLGTFVIPGADVARAHGLDIEAAGLHWVASPRHASVLLVIGPISPALREAAAVVYAQMMRPRVLFALGAEALSPLPAADIASEISQQGLMDGVHRLQHLFADNAFRPDVVDFDTSVLQVRIKYTCPMHPEVVRDEPGSCPKCGMDLVPRETQASTEQMTMKPEKTDTQTDTEMQAAVMHDHQHASEETTNEEATVEYTCPMHPEVVQSEPGSCPKCGMNLVPRETKPESPHEQPHASNQTTHEHADMTFMSMVDVTKDLPRSDDGLPMEWIDAPFGPFFPGLPGGLLLELTLDGDTVVTSDTRSLTGNNNLLPHSPMDSSHFVEHLAAMDPLAPLAYRLLACRALEDAASVVVTNSDARARIGALERERIASHLGWLVLFAQQTGFDWLLRQAGSLQLKCQHADLQQVTALKPDIQSLITRLQRTPLLKSRTVGIGQLTADTALGGPVARASGIGNDARSADKTFTALGFTPVSRKEGDAYARLHIRLDEITHSLALIEAAGAIERPALPPLGKVSASGEASVETARGPAHLQITLEKGRVITAQLETPSTQHLALIEPLVEQQELGDALLAVGSLDLSPWSLSRLSQPKPSQQTLVQ